MFLPKSIFSLNSSASSKFPSTPASCRVQPQNDDIDEVTTDDRWSSMLPELLGEIIRRVEKSEDTWPIRKSVVSCACVCRRWRRITTEIVGSIRDTGLITFPSSLKQAGPKELPIQCFIKRNKKNATFYLYLSLTQLFMDKGKFLMAARRVRHGAHIEYVISLDADNISQGSSAYLGKLRSDFLGTKFTMFDTRAPHTNAKSSGIRKSCHFTNNQISPQLSIGNFEIGHISYKFNLLKSRGPRRMICKMQPPPSEEENRKEESEKEENKSEEKPYKENMVLWNKVPRWHEHLQCWCLNFHGRVTIASVKNFQLTGEAGGDDSVLLQFGKVGDELFTMDYREPLSAFQAFAICLSSFGTKFACE